MIRKPDGRGYVFAAGVSEAGGVGEVRVEAMAAARFVQPRCADEHAIRARNQALGVVRRIAADDADREGLGDVLGDREQLRHRLERTAQVVLIQSGHDHALAAIRERVARGRQIGVEELTLVDADDFGVAVHARQEFVGRLHVLRRNPHLAVRDDMAVAVAVVDERLEDLDLLLRDLCAAQPADELLALAAEHAAGDDFDPPVLGTGTDYVHTVEL